MTHRAPTSPLVAQIASIAIIALLAACAPHAASAHSPGNSHLSLDLGAADGEPAFSARWDIALKDLDLAIGLDADGDAAITWGEVRARHAVIADYALSRLHVATAGGAACTLEERVQAIAGRSDGTYSVLELDGHCPGGAAPAVLRYALFFDRDAGHRGLLSVRGPSGVSVTALSPAQPEVALDSAGNGLRGGFTAYLRSGIRHIAIGLDHIAFLLSLLLPCVLWRAGARWQPRRHFTATAIQIGGVVTAFTLAHSLTLAVAVLGWVVLPARLVESAIAASVVAVAVHNVWPIWRAPRWLLAFVLGLVHGFGFASVLIESGLPAGALASALLGFNLGVEAGQLLLVAAVLPLAWMARATWLYRPLVVTGGSLVIAALATLWLLERSLAVQLLPA